MNTYIKFEDTYGMADIFTKIRYDSFLNEDCKKYQDCIVRRRLSSPSVLELNNRDIGIICKNKATRIVVVFDMDNTDGLKDKIIDIHKVIEYHNKSEQKLREKGIESIIEYVPITYAAESISICQFIDKFEAEYVMDTYNTTKLHKEILKKLMIKRGINVNSIKKTRNFIDKIEQLNGLKSLSGLNTVCTRFITNLDALSFEKCIEYLNTLYNIFYNHYNPSAIEDNYNKIDTELGMKNSYKKFCLRCNNKCISDLKKDSIEQQESNRKK